MDRAAVILWTLAAYKAALIGLGIWAQRRTKDEKDFYLGGRRLGAVVAAVSAAASSSSAWTILGVSGSAYAWGLSALWLFPSCVGGFLINWLLLARPLRRASERTGALTATDMIAGFGGGRGERIVRATASAIILGALGLYVSFQFQAAGLAFHRTLGGVSLEACIAIGAAIVLLYTMLGGFWAASLTDTLQGLLMALTAVALPAAALFEVGGFGGLGRAIAECPQPGYASLFGAWEWPAAIGFVAGLFGIALGYPGQPHVVNRLMALADDGPTLRRARRVAIGWAVVVYAGMLLLGLCGRALIPSIENNEALFIELANTLLHPVAAGLVVAALLSAIMSTADSQLLAAASSATHDLNWRRRKLPGAVAESRVVILLLGAGAVAAAIFIDEKIFRGVLFAWGAVGSAIGPPLLVTVFRGPLRSDRLVIAMLLGTGLSIAAYEAALPLQQKALENVLPFAASLAVCLLPGSGNPGPHPAKTISDKPPLRTR